MLSSDDIREIISDYTVNDLTLLEIGKKNHISKKTVSSLLRENGIDVRKRGGNMHGKRHTRFEPHEGYHYLAVDRNDGYTTSDYLNLGGFITSHIRDAYGVEIPTRYQRNKYLSKYGVYWWEQWFDIIEAENRKTKKCPYCGWETTDVENNNGAFMMHLMREHGLTREEYIREHPEDREYLTVSRKLVNLSMSDDDSEFVTCAICGKRMSLITTTHLQTHGITKEEYIEKYGKDGMVSKKYHELLSENAVEMNKSIEPTYKSKWEFEVIEYINSLGFECKSDRKILSGRELDIYVEDKKLAIELNGNFWHSEKNGKDRTYHLRKLEDCNREGIRLIQVFEDEYAMHRELVLAKIAIALGVYDGRRIGARECAISSISQSDAKAFLEDNDIQGYSSASVHLGAYHEGSLVGVMSFMNTKGYEWNLIRFATLNGTICRGLGSRMFRYFTDNYRADTVKSFADRRWTLSSDDNLFTRIGFKLDGIMSPDYSYYNKSINRNKRFSRNTFRKEKLVEKYGFDNSMTESEMMDKLGYVRIYDCGSFRYEWSMSA